jgi:hypothetical protein
MKNLFLMLCVMLLITSISTNIYAEENNFFGDFQEAVKIDNLKNEISQINSFEIWKQGKINFDSVIYDSVGNLKLNLYSVINDEGVIGYMLTDIKTNVIVEFAIGESPYESYIQRNNEKTILADNDLKLIKDAGNYFTTENNFETIESLRLNSENRNALDAVNRTLEEQTLNIQPLGEVINVTIIKGVPDEYNNGTTPGCGPVSGINLVKYWDTKGYPNLVLSSDTKQSLYDRLYNSMLSFPVPFSGGQVATLPENYGTGLDRFFRSCNANYGVSVDADYFVSNTDFSKLRTEVNNNRPGTILYFGDDQYKQHYVTFVGYCQELDGQNMYIVRDLWSTTPTDIYRNWNWDASVDSELWGLYLIRPYQ